MGFCAPKRDTFSLSEFNGIVTYENDGIATQDKDMLLARMGSRFTSFIDLYHRRLNSSLLQSARQNIKG